MEQHPREREKWDSAARGLRPCPPRCGWTLGPRTRPKRPATPASPRGVPGAPSAQAGDTRGRNTAGERASGRAHGHPPKGPAAAVEHCCSEEYFQHRNKQCEWSVTPSPRNGTHVMRTEN